MALRSVLTVDVDDPDFRRYAEAFGRYQQDLKEHPGLWSKASEAAGTTANAAREMGSAMGAAVFALHKINEENDDLTRGSKDQASAWSSMATNAGKFTSRVIEATRSLLRWGELTGLISGILGGGGLYGIERLATSASSQRRNAL